MYRQNVPGRNPGRFHCVTCEYGCILYACCCCHRCRCIRVRKCTYSVQDEDGTTTIITTIYTTTVCRERLVTLSRHIFFVVLILLLCVLHRSCHQNILHACEYLSCVCVCMSVRSVCVFRCVHYTLLIISFYASLLLAVSPCLSKIGFIAALKSNIRCCCSCS